MNPTFETIRKELKKYNAEENEVPPKLILTGENDPFDIEQKRKQNSQFIIRIKRFSSTERQLIENMLDQLRLESQVLPLAFFYDDKEAIKTVMEDFQDYYNLDLGPKPFQTIDAGKKEGQFCLIILVFESPYYK